MQVNIFAPQPLHWIYHIKLKKYSNFLTYIEMNNLMLKNSVIEILFRVNMLNFKISIVFVINNPIF